MDEHIYVEPVLSLSQTSPCFMCLQYKSFENTVGKVEVALKKQFLLFPQIFVPFWRIFHHFNPIQNCYLQSFSIRKSLFFLKYLNHYIICHHQMLEFRLVYNSVMYYRVTGNSKLFNLSKSEAFAWDRLIVA